MFGQTRDPAVDTRAVGREESSRSGLLPRNDLLYAAGEGLATHYAFATWSAFDSHLQATMLAGQSVHPFAQAIGFVVVESAAAGKPPGRPLTAQQMAALLESQPTGAGHPARLQVLGVVVTGNGLRVRFNQPFDPRALLADEARRPRIDVMRDGVPVEGRIVSDPDGEGFAFIVEGPLLRDGAYTVRLRGFMTPGGEALDGDYDGKPGGDYRGRFEVTGATLRMSAIDKGGAATLAAVQPSDAPIELTADLDWMSQRWSVEADAAGDSRWAALTGGIGGLATLAAMPAGFDHRMARQARAAGARRRNADDSEAPMRIGNREAAGDPAAITRAPAWLSRWLGQREADKNEWRIRP